MFGSSVANKIMSDINHKYSKMGTFRSHRQRPENRKCRCLVCGQVMPSLLAAYAAKHGYSKAEMIDKGLVEWL